ncbi:MAG: hypothetical protein OXU68_07845 [Bacteroidota bacterium]|nr:hypothetical protein [Bacteroidota bacterium]
MKRFVGAVCLLACLAALQQAAAQSSSRNLVQVGSVAIEGGLQAIHADQDANRPWVYALDTSGQLLIIDMSDPADARPISQGVGRNAHTLTSFREGADYFLVLGGEQLVKVAVADPAAPMVLDSVAAGQVLADLFAYKHSSGATLIFAAGSENVSVYTEEVSSGPLLSMEIPDHPGPGVGFEDVFAGFDPESQQDRLYLAAAGGYYVYDITSVDHPVLQTTVHSAAVQRGRIMAPISDGRHALTLASYRTAPMRIFPLTQERVRTAVGAWTDNWQSELVDVVVRWPYAFVAALEHGLQVVNVFDPYAPYTDAWFRSTDMEDIALPPMARAAHGIADVDVRNHDGLIVAADLDYGLWMLELEAFMGWHGHSWGLPNMSDVQDWNHGPDGN